MGVGLEYHHHHFAVSSLACGFSSWKEFFTTLACKTKWQLYCPTVIIIHSVYHINSNTGLQLLIIIIKKLGIRHRKF